jgi:hypothetical protein
MSFADDVRRFSLNVDTRINDVFLGCVQDAHAAIVVGSPLTGSPGQPVDTGYLRSSWQVAIGRDPQFISKGDGTDNKGTSEVPLPAAGFDASAAVGILSGQATRAVIATNVEYAPIIEDRHPSKAKSVAGVVNNWDRIVDKNVREVTGGNP